VTARPPATCVWPGGRRRWSVLPRGSGCCRASNRPRSVPTTACEAAGRG